MCSTYPSLSSLHGFRFLTPFRCLAGSFSLPSFFAAVGAGSLPSLQDAMTWPSSAFSLSLRGGRKERRLEGSTTLPLEDWSDWIEFLRAELCQE